MTDELTFTKRVAKSGRGYLIWIPKDVVDFAEIKEDDTVEIKIKKLERKK
ncbi:hypothetical protein J4212_02790 [Candidatus Woesearchaeota archaeon]|nr:hypothetical protein [Candidatus Woesearchaeota archaeon]